MPRNACDTGQDLRTELIFIISLADDVLHLMKTGGWGEACLPLKSINDEAETSGEIRSSDTGEDLDEVSMTSAGK